MAVLAIDPGTQLGWALMDDKVVHYGTLNFAPRRFEGGGMRFLRFKRWLTDMNGTIEGSSRSLGEIVFEEVRGHKGTDAAQIYGGFIATLSAWCEAHEIPYRAIPVGEWKKNLTGKGNASKDLVKKTVLALGYPVETFDEADAIGILLAAVR